MKHCAKCGKNFPATTEYFYVCRRNKNGLMSQCKNCRKEYDHKYYKQNSEKISEYGYMYRKRNHEKILENARRYYYEQDEQNSKRRLEYRRQWRDQNRETIRDYYSRYMNQYRIKNPSFCIRHSISAGISSSLRDGKQGRRWESLVGYTIKDLMTHLESQFTKGMTWENYGEWHIDHIRPLSDFAFISADDPEFKECWSLWNLQPLWAHENLSKHAKCIEPPLPLLVVQCGGEEND